MQYEDMNWRDRKEYNAAQPKMARSVAVNDELGNAVLRLDNALAYLTAENDKENGDLGVARAWASNAQDKLAKIIEAVDARESRGRKFEPYKTLLSVHTLPTVLAEYFMVFPPRETYQRDTPRKYLDDQLPLLYQERGTTSAHFKLRHLKNWLRTSNRANVKEAALRNMLLDAGFQSHIIHVRIPIGEGRAQIEYWFNPTIPA